MNISAPIIFKKSAGVATITFNRPKSRNALTMQMCRDLIEFISGLNGDEQTRVLLLRGNGPDFCSGADLREMTDISAVTPQARAAEVGLNVLDVSQVLFTALHKVDAPIVAGVRGYAIGAGMQFVLAADLVAVSETAKLAVPQVRLGHTADHGESYYLPRKVGSARAMQILLLGEFVTAAQAGQFGLANWVVPDMGLDAQVDGIVGKLSASPPAAVFGMKELLRNCFHNTLEQQFAEELAVVKKCAATDDFVEAMAAAREKRPPIFRGR
ncbi:2-(1,2-epoxy-1,2-dihydrophenyl)acetyl-CoA isomerase [Acidocella aquatica]|uniref:2-(1,2-epoxy-1,2-dihydrophenyl)acetyl-CoA isomerase n=1 Tax=Acidocella aquatica TaxID=1922313 RepID=A0ABQ6A0N3_9PROT|nr:enoyl-CoA hydratase-related protein [Acidocella aquatica]GLR66010.1 2-(1,2-epoxy-1,2-dihydrophenyl)acetyl-CoA isomerase [Acidocella aquatica]